MDKKAKLNEFLQKVMKIDLGLPAMGGASSAIIGTTGMPGMVSDQLKKDALAFAAEYINPYPDSTLLQELADQLKGSILSVKMVSGISDSTLDTLMHDLDELLSF